MALTHIISLTSCTSSAQVKHGPDHNLKIPEILDEAETADFVPLYNLGYAARTESEKQHFFVTVDGSELIRNPGFRSKRVTSTESQRSNVRRHDRKQQRSHYCVRSQRYDSAPGHTTYVTSEGSAPGIHATDCQPVMPS